MKKMIETLEAELANLNERRNLIVEQAIRRLQNESSSRHLGHNLGNQATEISELAAKIEQTESILRALRNRMEFEGGQAAS